MQNAGMSINIYWGYSYDKVWIRKLFSIWRGQNLLVVGLLGVNAHHIKLKIKDKKMQETFQVGSGLSKPNQNIRTNTFRDN